MNDAELIAIMPVFNEEIAIASVITEWLHAFSGEQITYRLIAINDGSTDSTLSILKQLQSQFPEQLVVLNKANSGHGQTCRFGYEFALEQSAAWILQIDSDGQCDPVFLSEFLAKRNQADCIFGVRVIRDDGLMRKLVSRICRLLIAVVTGRDLRDPNVPYRLIERTALEKALRNIPQEFDLQNIALTLALKRNPFLRWAYVPIRFRVPLHAQTRMNFSKIVGMGFRMLIRIHAVKT